MNPYFSLHPHNSKQVRVRLKRWISGGKENRDAGLFKTILFNLKPAKLAQKVQRILRNGSLKKGKEIGI